MRFESSVVGVSYVGEPCSNTVVYATKKIEALLQNMNSVEGCIAFVEGGCTVPSEAALKNDFVFCENPLMSYIDFIQLFTDREREWEISHAPVFDASRGCYICPDAVIEDDVLIEPGAFIGNHVVLGKGTIVRSGATVKYARIGKNVLIKSNAVIGDQGFNFAKDESGNLRKLPSLGCVEIGDNAEIGCTSTVCRGTGGDTLICPNAKIDNHVHVGHDAVIGSNTEVTAGTVVGGYCRIGEGCFIGINSCLRNRINIGDNVVVGMGATVTKGVESGITVVGNPAKPFVK